MKTSYPLTLLIRTNPPTFSSTAVRLPGSGPSNRMQCLSFIPETASVMGITVARDKRHLKKRISAGLEACPRIRRLELFQNRSEECCKVRLKFCFLRVLCNSSANSAAKVFKASSQRILERNIPPLKREKIYPEEIWKKNERYV